MKKVTFLILALILGFNIVNLTAQTVTVDITFQADMTDLIDEGFDPIIHQMELRGPFNGWSAGDILQPNGLGENIYYITKEITGTPGGIIEWKFKANLEQYFINDGWEIHPGVIGEYGNRYFIMPDADSTLAPVLPHIYFIGAFIVNSTNNIGDINPGDGICDDGTGNCTLRAAIEEANANVGKDFIIFELPGTPPFSFLLFSAFPMLVEPVVIDGRTQWGYDLIPIIEVDGTNTTGSFGFDVNAGSSTIKGLVINNFDESGIRLTGNGNNIVESNFIGTDSTGMIAAGNEISGVVIENSNNNLIGGNTSMARNIISGNNCGIIIHGVSDSNIVIGNYIGTNITGTIGLGNNEDGILIFDDACYNQIGGEVGEENIIAFNTGSGILIACTGDILKNSISCNSIFTNGETGIDLSMEPVYPYRDGITPNDPGDSDSGPNNLQNFPLLSDVLIDEMGDLWIYYYMDSEPGNSTYPINNQFFKADNEGQGHIYIGADIFSETNYNNGIKATNLGNAAILGISNGDLITSTATDDEGNTSEFSSVIITGVDEYFNYSKADFLIQNYPNPFSISTTFEFELEEPVSVQISIFNHFGKKVDVIQQKLSSGKQQVVWNTEGLPSGVYYFKMQAGVLMASGKMLLVR